MGKVAELIRKMWSFFTSWPRRGTTGSQATSKALKELGG